MRRGGRLGVPVVVALVLLAVVPGCGRSPKLQRQESAVLLRTCQSLYERTHNSPAPSLPKELLRPFLDQPPHGFVGHSTRDEMHLFCDSLPGPIPYLPKLPPGLFKPPKHSKHSSPTTTTVAR